MAEQLKYRFTELLNKMPHERAVKLKEEIPEKCHISTVTWRNYRLRKLSDSTQIPSETLLKIALLMEVEPNELFTNPVEV